MILIVHVRVEPVCLGWGILTWQLSQPYNNVLAHVQTNTKKPKRNNRASLAIAIKQYASTVVHRWPFVIKKIQRKLSTHIWFSFYLSIPLWRNGFSKFYVLATLCCLLLPIIKFLCWTKSFHLQYSICGYPITRKLGKIKKRNMVICGRHLNHLWLVIQKKRFLYSFIMKSNRDENSVHAGKIWMFIYLCIYILDNKALWFVVADKKIIRRTHRLPQSPWTLCTWKCINISNEKQETCHTIWEIKSN